MKTTTAIVNILLSILILTQPIKGLTLAQTADRSSLKSQIEDNYIRLKSEDFEKRYKAVYFFSKLKKEEIPEEIFKAIIDLFKKEVDREKIKEEFFRRGGVAENLPKDIAYINSEEYGMYHGYLCNLVGKTGDKNLLPLLVEYCLRKEVLINFGDLGVDSVINVLKTSNNPDRKVSAIRVLGEMLKPKETGYVASAETRNRIEEALIQTTKDSDRYIRSAAVSALGDSGNKSVIPILEDIAKNDPYHFERKDKTSEKVETIYPVRERAEEALQKLKAKEFEKK